MAVIAGLLSSSTAPNNDLVGEFQESVFVRNAKGMNAGATLFGLMARLKAEPADNMEFNWWERPPLLRTTVATATSTSGSTTVTLQDGNSGSVFAYFANGTVLQNNRTAEFMLVNGDPTTDAITVVRGFASSTAAAVNIGDTFTTITQAQDEGSGPRRAVYADPGLSTNYIQTFGSSVSLTNAFKGQVLRTDLEGPLRERRIQALEIVSKDIELALLLGPKSRSAGANGYRYTTGGIKTLVDTLAPNNILNGQGSTGIDYPTLASWFKSFMTYGSDNKVGFCGPDAYQALSTFAMQLKGFQVYQTENVFGINITEIMTPFGLISLTMHPLFKELSFYNDWMIVVDLAHIIQKTFEPLFLQPDIQTPGYDLYQEQYRAKLGLKTRFPEAHAYAYGLSKINPPA